MKVRRVWVCECGHTKLLAPDIEGNTELIVKGDAFHTSDPVSNAQQILTRCCGDKYLHMPAIVQANALKKVWVCTCEEAAVIRARNGSILLQGTAFAYGSPTTLAKCRVCKDTFRLALDITWASHLALKQEKRSNSKKNRRAKKRRQKSF